MKTLNVAIECPSGKLVFANNLRRFFPDYVDPDEGYERAGKIWEKQITVNYAKVGMLHGFVGNTCPSIYLDGSTVRIANAPYRHKDDYEPDHRKIKGDKVGSICTDLWWFSAADYDDLIRRGATEKDLAREEIVSVEPGRYVMRYSYDARMLDDSNKVAIYATIERSDKEIRNFKFPIEGRIEKIKKEIKKRQNAGLWPEDPESDDVMKQTSVYFEDWGPKSQRYAQYRDRKQFKLWGSALPNADNHECIFYHLFFEEDELSKLSDSDLVDAIWENILRMQELDQILADPELFIKNNSYEELSALLKERHPC